VSTEGGVDAKLVALGVLLSVGTVGAVPLDVLSLDDFLDALVVLGLVVTKGFVDFGLLGFLGTVLLAFALGLGLVPSLLVGGGVQLGKQTLVGLLELLDVGLGVLQQIDLLLLEFLHLRLQGVRVQLELLLDLDKPMATLTFLRISISCFCSMFSNFRYSYSRLRYLMNSILIFSRVFR
jgi:hypothetical protein